MTILGFDFKGAFATAMGPLLHNVTLTKVTPGTYDPTDPSAGNRSTTVTVTGKGTSTKITTSYVDETTGARMVDFVAIVLLGTLSANVDIVPGDTLTVPDPTGGAGTTIAGRVIKVLVDPDGASATVTCKA